jgi:hypothetical protein
MTLRQAQAQPLAAGDDGPAVHLQRRLGLRQLDA